MALHAMYRTPESFAILEGEPEARWPKAWALSPLGSRCRQNSTKHAWLITLWSSRLHAWLNTLWSSRLQAHLTIPYLSNYRCSITHHIVNNTHTWHGIKRPADTPCSMHVYMQLVRGTTWQTHHEAAAARQSPKKGPQGQPIECPVWPLLWPCPGTGALPRDQNPPSKAAAKCLCL